MVAINKNIMAKSNPNKSNQYSIDPRQKLCWDLYVNPKSNTFGNAYQSALKAGYEVSYARTITDTEWFCEKVRRLQMLSKAERNLDEALDIGVKDKDIGDRCLKATLFVAERLGKDEGYSSRSELTGKDGEALIPDQDIQTKIDESINKYLNGNKGNTK